jgi:hypothetical protein
MVFSLLLKLWMARHSLFRRWAETPGGARRHKPRRERQHFRRHPRIEQLEDRCVPSDFSVTVTFINQTPSTLHFVSDNLDHGDWSPDFLKPGADIGPGQTAMWASVNTPGSIGTGTEGEATYQIGDDPMFQTTLHWNDPFNLFQEKTNTFDESAPTGFVSTATSPDPIDNNNVSANFAITLNRAARNFPLDPSCPPLDPSCQSNPPLNTSSWTAIDPGAIFKTKTPTNPIGASPTTVSGRVTGLAVDPTTDTIYAATAGGGVWKDVSNSSGNKPDSPAGNSSGDWVPLTENLPPDASGKPIPLFMGAIAETRDSKGNQIIYAGTGEANNSSDSYWGEGILVSQDGGQSWKLTGQAQFQGMAISQIVIDPEDPNTAWVAVSNNATNGNPAATTGIFKTSNGLASLNGGMTTWTNTTAAVMTVPPDSPPGTPPQLLDSAVITPGVITPGVDPWSALVIDPIKQTNGKFILFAAIGNRFGSVWNGVYQSIDSGATWNPVNGVPGVAGSGRIALTLSHPAGTPNATIYASIANASGSLQAFDVSTTGGGSGSWMQPTGTPNYLTTLGWYGNVILADPNTPRTVYAAGAGDGANTIIESTDGGATWPTDLSDSSKDTNKIRPHTDNHALVLDGSGRLLDGNDGGVWRLDSNNVSANPPAFTWEDLNGWETLNAPGLSINQITGIALSPASSQMILTGSQDNGTNVFKGGQSAPFVSASTFVAPHDGGFVGIDPTNTNPANPITAFTTFQYPNFGGTGGVLDSIQRIDDLGNANTLTNISGGLPGNVITAVADPTSAITGFTPTVTPTITTATPHGLSVGRTVNIAGVKTMGGVASTELLL